MKDFELKVTLADGKRIVAPWQGTSGEAAALSYADAHRGATVWAFREPRYGLFVGGADRIVE